MLGAGQEFFIGLKRKLEQMGYMVYDLQLPDDGAKYPFIYLGATDYDPSPLKSAESGRITQTVQVWGTGSMRGTVASIGFDVLRAAERVEGRHYGYMLIASDTTQTLRADDTTRVPLLQCLTNLSIMAVRKD